LPNPDPQADSASARLVAEHEPYMVATYSRPSPVFVKGEGSYLWDLENRRYLDFTAGIAVNGLGHCDPEFSKLIAQQVRKNNGTSHSPAWNPMSPWTQSDSRYPPLPLVANPSPRFQPLL
jgi:acetylornithine/succinyldiaminopimelate/putrescine aminotransferase